MEPESYLQAKGFTLRKAPGEHQTQCPFCGDTNRYGHLYINREHGAFMCHRCGEKGSFADLQVKLGDKPEPIVQDLAQKWAVWSDAVEVFQDALLEQPEALSYLREQRGLTAETIGKYRLGWAPRNFMERMLETWKVGDLEHAGLVVEREGKKYPLFWDRIMIPYIEGDHVVTVRGKQIGSNILQAKDTSIHLFGVDNIREQPETYICEGEFDAMFLDQLGYPACAVPGALNYQDHWNMWFEGSRRVYVCLDADEAGRKGADKIVEALGSRASIVEFPVPEGVKSTDITEYFLRDGHVKADFDELVITSRKQRIFTFGESLKDRDALLLKKGLKLGWPDLDFAIVPGLLPGQLVTLLAKTGAGKTAFLSQIIHNMSDWDAAGTGGPGLPVLMLSLEQTRSEIANRLERIGRLYNPFASSQDMDRWHRKLRIVDENRVPPEDVTLLFNEFIDDVGEPPALLVVDYLGYWARAFKGGSKYEQVSDAVMELKRIAKDLGVAIVSPHQVSRVGKVGQRLEMDFARDSGVIEETSDFVFSLFRPGMNEEDDDGVGYLRRADVRLELLKSRHGNVGRQVMMLWAPFSLALVPRGGDLEAKVQKEWQLHDVQAVYEDALKEHQSRPQEKMFT